MQGAPLIINEYAINDSKKRLHTLNAGNFDPKFAVLFDDTWRSLLLNDADEAGGKPALLRMKEHQFFQRLPVDFVECGCEA